MELTLVNVFEVIDLIKTTDIRLAAGDDPYVFVEKDTFENLFGDIGEVYERLWNPLYGEEERGIVVEWLKLNYKGTEFRTCRSLGIVDKTEYNMDVLKDGVTEARVNGIKYRLMD